MLLNDMSFSTKIIGFELSYDQLNFDIKNVFKFSRRSNLIIITKSEPNF